MCIGRHKLTVMMYIIDYYTSMIVVFCTVLNNLLLLLLCTVCDIVYTTVVCKILLLDVFNYWLLTCKWYMSMYVGGTLLYHTDCYTDYHHYYYYPRVKCRLKCHLPVRLETVTREYKQLSFHKSPIFTDRTKEA